MEFPDDLRIAVVPNTSLVLLEKNNGYYKIVGGPEGELIKLCAQALKFSYKMVPASDRNWGNLINGTWNGVIGMVHRNEADLAISKFAISEDRLEYFDFSYPYLIERLTFATQMPRLKVQTGALIRPFTKVLWLIIFITIIIVSLAFSFLQNINLIKSLQHSFAILMSKSVKIKNDTIKDKAIVIAWIFGSLFLSYSYMTVLLSYLTIPNLEKPPETFKELATEIIAGNYKAMTFRGSLITSELNKSKREDIKIIAQHIQRNDYLVEFKKEAFIETLRHEKFALICPSITLKFLLQNEFLISRDCFKPHLSAILISKTFCCKKKIDEFIHVLTQSGIYSKLLEDVIFIQGLKSKSQEKKGSSANKFRPLSLNDMYGAFILIIVGNALASVVVFVEIIHFKLYLLRRTNKSIKSLTLTWK